MAASVIIGYSDIPLLVSGAFGGLLLTGAALWGHLLTGRSLYGRAISEMAVAVAAIAGIGGLVLLNLGIVGAYLGRAAREAKERPMYFVSEDRNIPRPD